MGNDVTNYFFCFQNKFQEMHGKYAISHGLFHQISVRVVVIAAVPLEKQYSIVVSIGRSVVALIILPLLFFFFWSNFLNLFLTQFTFLLNVKGVNQA